MHTKDLENTWGTRDLAERGWSEGTQPNRGSRPRGKPAKRSDVDNALRKEGSPAWCRASRRARPSSFPRNAPSEGAQTVSDGWLSNGFISLKIECKSLCKIIIFMFASSKCIADLGMVPCIQHSHVPCSGHVCKRTPGPCAANGYRRLQTTRCLLTIGSFLQPGKTCYQNKDVQQKHQGESSQRSKFQVPNSILWNCCNVQRVGLDFLYLLGNRYAKYTLRENSNAAAQIHCKYSTATQSKPTEPTELKVCA